MKIETRTNGDCIVLDLDGQLVLGPATMALRQAVQEAVRKKPGKVVANLRKISYIDSCGVGELVSCLTHMRNQDGILVLLDPPRRVKDLLVITKLDTVFEIYDDEQTAVATKQGSVLQQRMSG